MYRVYQIWVSCISECDRVHLYQIMSFSSCISICDRVHLYQIMSYSSCISVCDKYTSTRLWVSPFYFSMWQSVLVPDEWVSPLLVQYVTEYTCTDNEFLLYFSMWNLYQIMSFSLSVFQYVTEYTYVPDNEFLQSCTR